MKELFCCCCCRTLDLCLRSAVSLQMLELSLPPACNRRGVLHVSVLYLAWRPVVINQVWFIEKKLVLLSARLHLHKPQKHTNRLWPRAIPPWNVFLYRAALLSTLPFFLRLRARTAGTVVFLRTRLWLSSMGSTWQRMHVAGLCLDTFNPRRCLYGHAAWEQLYPWRWGGVLLLFFQMMTNIWKQKCEALIQEWKIEFKFVSFCYGFSSPLHLSFQTERYW